MPLPAQTRRPYDSLWPLVMMGVLTPDHKPNGWLSQCTAPRKTRVAVIDTSVATEHPNLAPAINANLSLDLFSARLGSFPGRNATDKLGLLDLGASQDAVIGLPLASQLLSALTERLAPDQPAHYRGIPPATLSVFSAHGTAIAGLIGAQPVSVPADPGHLAGADDRVVLPYSGVDPFCEIVPISTNFDADPEQLILAFLYADLIKADVILLPRILPDPIRTVPELSAYVVDEMNETTLTEAIALSPITNATQDLWDELLELIVRISLRRPVVCAAGNAQEEFGVYPANFASGENGIIAVGAVNAKGWNCSYSPVRNLTVWAPSSDAERFDRSEVRLDSHAPDYDGAVIPGDHVNHKYSRYDIIGTDVPGDGGYAASPFDGPDPETGLREFGSYYCRFGGTSAASALVAGFLSLGQTAGQYPQGSGGVEAKTWLLGRCIGLGADHGEMVVPAWSGQLTFPDAN